MELDVTYWDDLYSDTRRVRTIVYYQDEAGYASKFEHDYVITYEASMYPEEISYAWIQSVLNHPEAECLTLSDQEELAKKISKIVSEPGMKVAKTMPDMEAKTITVTIKGKKQEVTVYECGIDFSKIHKSDAADYTKDDFYEMLNQLKKFQAKSKASGNPVYVNPLAAVQKKSFNNSGWKNIGYTQGGFSMEYTFDDKYWSDYWTQPVHSSFQAEAMRLSEMSKLLPGIDEEVDSPCNCKQSYFDELGEDNVISERHLRGRVWSLVQHLNDKHSDWTRERIADWIDELQDNHGLDFEFKVPIDEPLDYHTGGEVNE